MKNLGPKILREPGQNESVCLYNGCQTQLQSWNSLRVEIYIAARLFGIFADYLWKHMKKKKRHFENSLYLFGLAFKDQLNSIVE